MCKKNNQLVFCSCLNDNNTNLVDGFAWTLNRFVRSKTYDQGEPRIKGKIIPPTKELSDEINLDFVLTELNSRNCFDFDYTPKEKDCLNIHTTDQQAQYKYLKLLFKNGKWQYGSNPVFDTISESIFQGKIKRIED